MKISAPIKKLGAHQKIRRKSSALAYYLGSAESPTADFLQVWLKSSRSSDVASRACRPQVIWRLRPLCFYGRRLSRTVPACCTGTTCQNLCGWQILCPRLDFHHFLWKIQNPISASKCPITAPKICIWSLLLFKFGHHTHSPQNGGHPRVWPRLPKSVYNPVGGGRGGVWKCSAGQLAVITFEEGSERGGEEVSLDKQAMFAYLPSAFSSPSISLLQFLLHLFLAGCEALSR